MNEQSRSSLNISINKDLVRIAKIERNRKASAERIKSLEERAEAEEQQWLQRLAIFQRQTLASRQIDEPPIWQQPTMLLTPPADKSDDNTSRMGKVARKISKQIEEVDSLFLSSTKWRALPRYTIYCAHTHPQTEEEFRAFFGGGIQYHYECTHSFPTVIEMHPELLQDAPMTFYELRGQVINFAANNDIQMDRIKCITMPT